VDQLVSLIREGKSPAKALTAALHRTDSEKPCKILVAKGMQARKCLHSPERKHLPASAHKDTAFYQA